MVLLKGWGMSLGLLDGRRRLDGRDVRAEATGATRWMGESGGRRELAGGSRRGRILLAAAQGGKRSEGVGSFVGGVGEVLGGSRLLAGRGLVVEERIDAAHCRGVESMRKAKRSKGARQSWCGMDWSGVDWTEVDWGWWCKE